MSRMPPPVGTIVRILDYGRTSDQSALAVVVPSEWASKKYSALVAFTRTLTTGPCNSSNGWWIGYDADNGDYEIVPEDEVSAEIAALAMRCLLDPNFVPFVNDVNKDGE